MLNSKSQRVLSCLGSWPQVLIDKVILIKSYRLKRETTSKPEERTIKRLIKRVETTRKRVKTTDKRVEASRNG